MKQMKRVCQSLILESILLNAVLAPLSALADGPAWAVADAPVRLRLEPEAPGPQGDAGYSLISAGTVLPEQALITVTVPGGAVVSSSIPWARTGQPLLLVFDTTAKAPCYYAYIKAGSPDPAAPGWLPKAGVLHETRSLARPCFDSRAQFDQAWNSASNVFGRSVRVEIFDGVHSHGPMGPFLARYDAWFQVKQAGEYGFATLSDDASFVSVDDKPVAEWPGLHGTDGGRYGEKKGSLRLEPGLHHLRYNVAQADNTYAAVASWRPPGKDHFVVMQPADFARLDRFTCRAAEARPPLPNPAHFEWKIAHSAKLEKTLLSGVAFHALPVPKATYAWDFGDGVKGTGADTNHAYIGPGLRKVRLEMTRPDQPVAVLEQMVDVQQAWRQAEECPDSAVTALRSDIQARPVSNLSLPELEMVVEFAERLGDRIWLEQAGTNCLVRGSGFSESFTPWLEALARNFRQPQFGQFENAELMFGLAQAAAEKSGDKRRLARIRMGRAENRIYGLFQFEPALELLEATPDTDLDEHARRQKRLLTADALMSLGRRDDAVRLIRAIPPIDSNTMGTVRLQARLATAADLVRRQEWDAASDRLESIMFDYPPERFRGETGLLLMEAWAGRGQTIPALVMAERLLKVDLLDDVHARLLLRAADLHKILEDPASVRRYKDELKREFPYSEAAAKATPD
jgi:hypothetical protein